MRERVGRIHVVREGVGRMHAVREGVGRMHAVRVGCESTCSSPYSIYVKYPYKTHPHRHTSTSCNLKCGTLAMAFLSLATGVILVAASNRKYTDMIRYPTVIKYTHTHTYNHTPSTHPPHNHHSPAMAMKELKLLSFTHSKATSRKNSNTLCLCFLSD